MNMNDTGCPLQLDCSCVFYGTKNNGASALTASRLPNGAGLATILEAHELLIGQLKAQLLSLQNQMNKPNT